MATTQQPEQTDDTNNKPMGFFVLDKFLELTVRFFEGFALGGFNVIAEAPAPMPWRRLGDPIISNVFSYQFVPNFCNSTFLRIKYFFYPQETLQQLRNKQV